MGIMRKKVRACKWHDAKRQHGKRHPAKSQHAISHHAKSQHSKRHHAKRQHAKTNHTKRHNAKKATHKREDCKMSKGSTEKRKTKRHLAKGQKTSVGTELALSAWNSTPWVRSKWPLIGKKRFPRNWIRLYAFWVTIPIKNKEIVNLLLSPTPRN